MNTVARFKNRDVISILDFTREELHTIFKLADNYEKLMLDHPLEGKILALAFFEPSTRTRLSFETAMKRLGGDTIGFAGTEATSIAKGESFTDTIRMLDRYADAIVIRHPMEGAAKYAAEVARHPVINGGDGKQHHPTQAMLDLYTIYKLFGEIDGLTYTVLGDLRYARTAASFLLALTLFKPRKVYLVSPPQLKLRREVKMEIDRRRLSYEEAESLEEVLPETDVLYVVRIQKERFPDPEEYERVRGSYRVTLELLEKYAKPSLKILHPLPKIDEIDYRVDQSDYAAYFTQAEYGVRVRMALLYSILAD
ncbi:MAG: aspartate carbamoyltransferase [Pyrodictiaceae archaeon]